MKTNKKGNPAAAKPDGEKWWNLPALPQSTHWEIVDYIWFTANSREAASERMARHLAECVKNDMNTYAATVAVIGECNARLQQELAASRAECEHLKLEIRHFPTVENNLRRALNIAQNIAADLEEKEKEHAAEAEASRRQMQEAQASR